MGVVDLGLSGYIHRPWANTFQTRPELYFQPSSVEQVQQIVRRAAAIGKNVVVTGATHSPSILTATSQWLMNLDKLDQILDIQRVESQPMAPSSAKHNGESGARDVTVQAGIRLYALNSALEKHGLTLQSLGSISEQSVAGVISTGTHGSSSVHGLISSQITRLKVVMETGELLTASDHENPELFSALLLGLGAFGVIVEATVRCVPAFNLESRAYVVDFDELLRPAVWDTVFTHAEFHRVWWYPYAGRCYVWQAARTTKPQQPAAYSFSGSRLGRWLYEALLWVTVRWMPRLTPKVERWYFARQFRENTVDVHVGRSDREINMDCLFKQFVNEWSLPLTEGPAVLRALRDAILEEKWYVHSPFEIRASNTTLPSPGAAQGGSATNGAAQFGNLTRPLLDPSPELPYSPDVTNEQLTLNLNATMFRPFRVDPDVDAWYSCFEEVCARHGGKPHWAKNFRLNPWTWPENRGKVEQWQALRRKYAPLGIFGGQAWLREKQLV